MSGSASMILQALEHSKGAKDLIWRAVRTGCQESPIPPMLTTVSGWAQQASVTRTCAWPSTAMSASTSQKVSSASPLLPADMCQEKRGLHGGGQPEHHPENWGWQQPQCSQQRLDKSGLAQRKNLAYSNLCHQ